MESKSSAAHPTLSSTTSHPSNRNTTITTTSNSSVLLPAISTSVATSKSSSPQAIPTGPSSTIHSTKNTNSARKDASPHLARPTYPVKQERSDESALHSEYSLGRTLLAASTPIPLNLHESLHGLSALPMSMANIGGHLIPTLNPPHLTENSGAYYLSSLPGELPPNYKLPRSSNTDLPSPSNSSNSSNPSTANHHPGKRHEEGGDPTRKRAVRLQKNRDAARECRRKKKEYIKCLEERVTGLENQNKALIEELRQLKELYCRREDTGSSKTTANSR